MIQKMKEFIKKNKASLCEEALLEIILYLFEELCEYKLIEKEIFKFTLKIIIIHIKIYLIKKR